MADLGRGRIAQRSIDEVRERADLVELVEARMGEGRRSSGQVMTRCPFHEERTASFRIQPTDKLFYCFGCQASGSLFDYVQRTEGVGFAEAVEWLADRYGIELEREQVDAAHAAAYDRRQRSEELLGRVARFYASYLASDEEAEPARRYLRERGVSQESIERFQLGFAPDSWQRVVDLARAKGYAASDLIEAGIATEGRRGPIDRFRGRIMFPLCDARGRVRGFGARTMPDGPPPKYLNSSESETFQKGRIVYGLHLARQAIARRGRVIVVEGYMDVIALHAAGYEEAVASMGTALTAEQVAELRRLTTDIVLCFDADAAGQAAAVRGMQVAEQARLRVRIAPVPSGKDPAELLESGPDAFEAALTAAQTVLVFQIDRTLATRTDDQAAFERCRALLADAPPGPERDACLRRVTHVLRLSNESAAALVGRRRVTPATPAPAERPRRRHDPRRAVEREVLGAALAAGRPGADVLAGLRELFRTEPGRALVDWVLQRAADPSTAVPDGHEGAAATVSALSARHVEDYPSHDDLMRLLRTNETALRIEDATDRISALKDRAGSDDYTREDQITLNRLQRELATLKEQLRRGG